MIMKQKESGACSVPGAVYERAKSSVETFVSGGLEVIVNDAICLGLFVLMATNWCRRGTLWKAACDVM
jgi:hypothetical protein